PSRRKNKPQALHLSTASLHRLANSPGSKFNRHGGSILNRRQQTESPFISPDVWKSCGGPVGTPEGPVFAGLDLSARTDLTALVLIWRDGNTWQVQPHFWTPEKGLQDRAKRDRVPYDVWERQGFLHTTPGASIDYSFVAADMAEILGELDVQGVAFDRWRMDVLQRELDAIGLDVPLIEWGQGFKDMAPALDALEAELLNGRVAHGAHPVLTMCAANAVVTKDPAGSRKLDKARATGRIDGMQALAMAVGLAARSEVAEMATCEVFYV
ncbi:MAG: terminase TerL endonuclease subunit, partial [Brachymonas denitrificans]